MTEKKLLVREKRMRAIPNTTPTKKKFKNGYFKTKAQKEREKKQAKLEELNKKSKKKVTDKEMSIGRKNKLP